MKFLPITTIITFLFCQSGFAAVITQVDSDWSVFNVELIADADYTSFGGGSAGDVFNVSFEFNRAYLPYINSVNSEMQALDYSVFLTGEAPDNTTPALDDFLQMDALPLRPNNALTWDINGNIFNTFNPFALTLTDGAISSFTSSVNVFGLSTFFLGNNFYLNDAKGHIGSILDTAPNVVASNVPEPGVVLLMLTGLLGFAWRFKRSA